MKDAAAIRVIKESIKQLRSQLRKLELSQRKPMSEPEQLKIKLTKVNEEIAHVHKMLDKSKDPKQLAALKT